jgi:hypothetical protein
MSSPAKVYIVLVLVVEPLLPNTCWDGVVLLDLRFVGVCRFFLTGCSVEQVGFVDYGECLA